MFPLRYEPNRRQKEKKPVPCYNSGAKMRVGDKIEIKSLYAYGKLWGYDVQKGHMGTITKISPRVAHNQTMLFIEMNDGVNKTKPRCPNKIILRIRECGEDRYLNPKYPKHFSSYSYFKPVIKKPHHKNLQIWNNQSKNFEQMDFENVVLEEGLKLPEPLKEPRSERKIMVDAIIDDIRNNFEILNLLHPADAQRLADDMEREEGSRFRKEVLDGLAPVHNSKKIKQGMKERRRNNVGGLNVDEF